MRKSRKHVWPVSPCSCRSRRSRFMILKRSVRCISDVKITAKYSKTAKVCMACFSSFVPFALFAVHGIQVVSAIDSNRERRENREQKRECLRKPLIHSQKGLPKGICPKSRATGVFFLSPILPPVVAQNLRKFVLVCFSMFASFALFAVHVFHLECSLSF